MTAATTAAPTTGAAAPPNVLGLDLAAEQSGIAFPTNGNTSVILAPKVKGKRTLAADLTRLDHITGCVTDILRDCTIHLAVIEDYAPGIRSAAAHRLAEISGAVRLACWRAGVPLALVNPMHLKVYATGSSKATKSQMATAALKRAGLEFATDDECDAWWLRMMGLDWLGHATIILPKSQRDAMLKVTWPETAVAR